MIGQRSLRFRLRLYFFPFRIGLERGPIFLCFFTTGMLQDIDKEVLRIRRIFGPPITNAFHVMTLKEGIGVITKASYESLHFAWVNVIHSQFLNVVGRNGRSRHFETDYHSGAANKGEKVFS